MLMKVFINVLKKLNNPYNLRLVGGMCSRSDFFIVREQFANLLMSESTENKSPNSNDLPQQPSTVGSLHSDGNSNFPPSYSQSLYQSTGRNEESIYSQSSSRIVPSHLLTGLNNNYFMHYPFPPQIVSYPMPFYYPIFEQNVLRGYFHRPLVGDTRSYRNPENNSDEKVMSLRYWEKMPSGKPSSNPGFIFTLMSYNILAQDLVDNHPYLYSAHDQRWLSWKVRWKNLYKEIAKLNPDILCLQEVQESHLQEYFSLLETLGYRGLYKKRTGERTDGCAIYYKADNINLVEHTTVEYFQPSVSLLNRDNVGIIAKFVPKMHPTREFVVATTHLLYNPRRSDVRLAQIQLLLTEMERISYKKGKEKHSYVPLLITGDLNSPPDSDLYHFIRSGEQKYDNLPPKLLKTNMDGQMQRVLVTSNLGITDKCQHADLVRKRHNNVTISRTEEISLIDLQNSELNVQKSFDNRADRHDLISTGSLSHNFYFKSVYDHGVTENSEGTTFQNKWLTVDYIFYSAEKDENSSEDKIKLLSRYRLPKEAELDNVRIPSKNLGSDHLSLLAKFKLEFL